MNLTDTFRYNWILIPHFIDGEFPLRFQFVYYSP